MPPSFQIFCVTVDSYVGTKLFKILLPAVVLTSFVQKRSFTAIGMPGSFKSKFGLSSNSFESLRQFSKFSVTYTFIFFDFSALSTKDFAASFEDIFFSLIFLINS